MPFDPKFDDIYKFVIKGAADDAGATAMEMAEHHTDDLLSLREIEVLQLVAAGNANKLVADNLSISEDTVKAHMRSILSKLNAKDRTHAVTIAAKRGIIDRRASPPIRWSPRSTSPVPASSILRSSRQRGPMRCAPC